MKKIYVEPRTEAMEIENEGMLCDSGASGSMGDPAGGAALTREDEWDDEWI